MGTVALGVLQVGFLVHDGGGGDSREAEEGAKQKSWGLDLALGQMEGRQAH